MGVFRNLPTELVLSYLSWQFCQHYIHLQGECKMVLPQTISGWCMWLFFLVFGINAFVPMAILGTIAGILALGYAIAALFGK